MYQREYINIYMHIVCHKKDLPSRRNKFKNVYPNPVQTQKFKPSKLLALLVLHSKGFQSLLLLFMNI